MMMYLLHKHGNGVAVDDQFVALDFNGALESAVGCVVLEHVHLAKIKLDC